VFDPISATIGAIGVGGSLLGGYMGKRASDKATNAASASADQANQLQYDMFREQNALMAPWVQSGGANLNRLNYAMYGDLPTAESMQLDPYSMAYQNWMEENPTAYADYEKAQIAAGVDKKNIGGMPLYRNPITGEISTTAPTLTADQMGVEGGSLDPSWRFSMQDWYDSPEYQVYNQARDVSIRQGQDAINAQNAARGMFGSGTWANALASNISDQYAKYNPASLAAARSAAEAARTQQYNMMVGMANPTGAQQVANYAGQYGTNAAQLMQAAGNAQAQGIIGGNNAMWNGVNSGLNQIGSAYGNYQGQQNFNALLQALQRNNGVGTGVGGMNWNQIYDMAGWNLGTDY
jgi:hypothetical protein